MEEFEKVRTIEGKETMFIVKTKELKDENPKQVIIDGVVYQVKQILKESGTPHLGILIHEK